MIITIYGSPHIASKTYNSQYEKEKPISGLTTSLTVGAKIANVETIWKALRKKVVRMAELLVK
jgi:hypothetical protein